MVLKLTNFDTAAFVKKVDPHGKLWKIKKAVFIQGTLNKDRTW